MPHLLQVHGEHVRCVGATGCGGEGGGQRGEKGRGGAGEKEGEVGERRGLQRRIKVECGGGEEWRVDG